MTENSEGTQYVQDCMHKKYEELTDTISWDDPVFQNILKPLNSFKHKATCKQAKALSKKYGDFGILYWWWGSALMKMGSLDKARKVMTDALEKVNRKYALCSGLAEVEWKARNLKKMVYWLAQAMHAQESLSEENYGSLADSYLHLSCVAEGLGLFDCSLAYLRRVDAINYSVRLTPSFAPNLLALTQSGKDNYIKQVITGLVEMYIKPD